MKALSAALIVMAGLYTLTAAVSHMGLLSIPGMIMTAVSFAIIGFGMSGWWACLKYDR
ncbi:hypothetical protein KBB96_01910 [Luteolibacter ambystomatis]|uniref:Uncharacterized protein n=1 Tax=Luteolibacter ambystomatis TaxID=2824561 RepID=A0A975J0B0_9BACT|nr:hypothetical protein [Luteolibacter ambystomatis]QUE51660.1 hypothetical protein KBB96_01910 [Luteolibacter ambystomatis]